MGLLQKVSAGGITSTKEEASTNQIQQVQKKSNSVGLLKKSLSVSQNDKLDFFEFIQKYNISLCSLLKLHKGFYNINKSFGFDGKSICLSHSTQDFWDGTIKEKNNLYTYKSNTTEILPFYQFFSEQLKEKIELIHIYKLEDNSIFLFITDKNFTIPDSFVFDLQNVDFNKDCFNKLHKPDSNNIPVFLYDIDLSESLDSYILSNSKNNPEIIDAISEQIYFYLIEYFPSPSYVEKQATGKFKLYYCIPEAISVELLSNHLRTQLRFVLDNHSDLIQINLQAE